MTDGREWLIDKSALARLARSPDADEWVSRVQRGLVRIATPTLLEVGYSAGSASDWVLLMEGLPVAAMPTAFGTPRIELRAVEVQGILARRGQHRAPSVPDLLIAATAELNGWTVLHLDKDFELIADITGQPVERLILREADSAS